MHFPFYIWLGPVPIHPHPLFESLAYLVGFWLYFWLRARRGDHVSEVNRRTVIAAGAIGGAVGSKLISLVSDPLAMWAHATGGDAMALIGGKGIVGAIAAAVIVVEVVKKRVGITGRTGDLFALPL